MRVGVVVRMEADTDIDEKYNRAKMLSQPLTVCTVDQLFKFVYKALGRRFWLQP